MKTLSSRTAGFTDSVIRRMTRVSNRYGAVNLSQGFPDFDPPQEILKRLAEVSGEDYNQYSITWGAQNLREGIAQKQRRYMGMDIDPDREIVVTCGSTEAMMAAVMTVTDPGDKLIIFSPFYENYGADVILSGAEPIYVPLRPPAFDFDPEELEAAFRQNPKALILCNPSNPSGKVFTREELELIAGLAEKYDTYVITDEVYEHIVYKPYQHVYFASLPGMRERTVVLNGFSKSYAMTGWRIGYAAAPIELIPPMAKMHAYMVTNATSLSQYGALEALTGPQDSVRLMREEFEKRRNFVVSAINDMPYLRCNKPKGAFYVFFDVAETGMNGEEFVRFMIHHGVAMVPGTAFGESGKTQVRLSYAASMEALAESMKRMRAALETLGTARTDKEETGGCLC